MAQTTSLVFNGGAVPSPAPTPSGSGKAKLLKTGEITITEQGMQVTKKVICDPDSVTSVAPFMEVLTSAKLAELVNANSILVLAEGDMQYLMANASVTVEDETQVCTAVNFLGLSKENKAKVAYNCTRITDEVTLQQVIEVGEPVETDFNLVIADPEDTEQKTLIDKLEIVDNVRDPDDPDDPPLLQLETTVDAQGNRKVGINEDNLIYTFDQVFDELDYIDETLGELPSDEHGYFNSSIQNTPGDGTTTSINIDDFRISQGRDVHGESIEFIPTHQEGGVDFGEVYLNPGTYILNVHYTLQWVGNPRGTFLPLVTNVGDQPFDFSYEHEDILRSTRIVTKTTRGKLGLDFKFDADTPPMGIWVKSLEVAQIASYNHPAVAHDTTLTGTGKLDSPLGVTPAVFGKVKDIPTSISQFRTGDVIPVDGPNGPAKMPASDLQNAILGGPIDEAVQQWLDEHPEATTTVQNGSLTEQKFTNALKLKTIKDYATPEMFGAAGDGVTDDTVAIQNALDAISGGGTLVLLGKTYLISSTLYIDRNVKVIGVSPYVSILQTNNDITVLELTDYVDVSGIVLSDFRIVGPGRVNSTKYGIYLNKTNYAVLRNVTVGGFSIGIKLFTAVNNTLDHCFVGYCTDGVYGSDGSYNNRIFAGTITACEHDGLSGTTSFKLSCYGLDIEACKHSAIGGNLHLEGYALHLEGSATSIGVCLTNNCRIVLKDCYLGTFNAAFKQESNSIENGVLIVENISLVACTSDFDAPRFYGYTISQYYTMTSGGAERAPVVNLPQYGGLLGRKQYRSNGQYDWVMTYGGVITNRLQANSIYEGNLRVVKYIYRGLLTFTASNIAANSTITVDIAMPAGTPELNTNNDSVIVNEVSFDNDILLKARVKDSATIQLSIRNVSNSTITLTNRNIHVHIIR